MVSDDAGDDKTDNTAEDVVKGTIDVDWDAKTGMDLACGRVWMALEDGVEAEEMGQRKDERNEAYIDVTRHKAHNVTTASRLLSSEKPSGEISKSLVSSKSAAPPIIHENKCVDMLQSEVVKRTTTPDKNRSKRSSRSETC